MVKTGKRLFKYFLIGACTAAYYTGEHGEVKAADLVQDNTITISQPLVRAPLTVPKP